MKETESKTIYIFPKIIIFGLALFNFFYIYSHIPPTVRAGEKISFYTPQWYETFDFIYVIILLFAAFLLLLDRKWNCLIAVILSGIVTIKGIIVFFRISPFEVWIFVQENNLDIFLQWEMQFLFSIIIFTTAIFYLIHKYKYGKLLK